MAGKREEQTTFGGKETIETALQLIRYDIPVLILGKSSIGKSYTLIKITEKWHISHTLLYIGSEKSENIEGVPKLTQRVEGKEILEYLQPYWFPNADVITKSVNNGRSVFDRLIKLWDVPQEKFSPTFPNLMSILNALENVTWDIDDYDKANEKFVKDVTLSDKEWIEKTKGDARQINSKPLRIERLSEISEEVQGDIYRRDDLKDLCAYLTTILGYGNYWLILDEIDKVEEMDTDKYAPLLHIVRERTLKNFRLVDINQSKGLGIPLGEDFQNGEYKAMITNVNRMLDAGESVLDTRVMAIANATHEIEDALFRRFVQLIAEEILIWRQTALTTDETNAENCLKLVKEKMVKNNLEGGSLSDGLQFEKLDDINLQWQYNFFPKMLNKYDILGNYFRDNATSAYIDSEVGSPTDIAWIRESKFTAFYKILKDNYKNYPIGKSGTFSVPNELFTCMQEDLLPEGTELGSAKETIEEQIESVRGILMQKEEDGLKPEEIALDIAMKMRNSYPKATTKERDKLNKLSDWTNSLIAYLNGAIFSSATAVHPLDVSKHLIPVLTNVFYTELANDSSNITDNVVGVVSQFQAFFYKISEASEDFQLDCNVSATQEALYGGSKSDIEQLSDRDKKALAPTTLFGADIESWVHSASGNLLINQMEDSLQMSIPILINKHSLQTLVAKLKEDGAIEFMKENYQPQLEELNTNFENQFQSAKDGKKMKEAEIYNGARTLTNYLTE